MKKIYIHTHIYRNVTKAIIWFKKEAAERTLEI